MKVKANKVANFDACKNPGDFFFTRLASGERRLMFRCPCGCGDLTGILLKNRTLQQTGEEAWDWNGDEQIPTCSPSIKSAVSPGNGGCRWHGFLTAGEFVSC